MSDARQVQTLDNLVSSVDPWLRASSIGMCNPMVPWNPSMFQSSYHFRYAAPKCGLYSCSGDAGILYPACSFATDTVHGQAALQE